MQKRKENERFITKGGLDLSRGRLHRGGNEPVECLVLVPLLSQIRIELVGDLVKVFLDHELILALEIANLFLTTTNR